VILFIVLAHDCLVSPFPSKIFLLSSVELLFVFRPLWASIFSLSGQRKGTKRKATLPCWPSASLCASAWSGRCGTRCAQTVLALLRSKLPVLDNTKGVAVKIWPVAPEIEVQTYKAKCSSYRRGPASRIINMSNKIDSG